MVAPETSQKLVRRSKELEKQNKTYKGFMNQNYSVWCRDRYHEAYPSRTRTGGGRNN